MMKKITYYFDSDILFIQLSRKKSSVGDQEYQDDVILFRDQGNNEITGVEIMNFGAFKCDHVQISNKEALGFDTPFKFIRMILSLQDIEGTPEYEEILEQWGIKIIKKTNIPDEINVPTKHIPTLTYPFETALC